MARTVIDEVHIEVARVFFAPPESNGYAVGGGVGEGLNHLDRALESFESAEPRLVEFRVGPSPGVVANVVSGLLLWWPGFPERAELRMG